MMYTHLGRGGEDRRRHAAICPIQTANTIHNLDSIHRRPSAIIVSISHRKCVQWPFSHCTRVHWPLTLCPTCAGACCAYCACIWMLFCSQRRTCVRCLTVCMYACMWIYTNTCMCCACMGMPLCCQGCIGRCPMLNFMYACNVLASESPSSSDRADIWYLTVFTKVWYLYVTQWVILILCVYILYTCW